MSTAVGSVGAVGASLVGRRPRRWVREVAYVGGFYGVYSVLRDVLPLGVTQAAMSNARSIASIEKGVGLWIEPVFVSGWALLPSWLRGVGSGYYSFAHLFVTLAVLVWLFLCRPLDYRRARTSLAAVSVISLPIFALFPVAPPWMLGGHGFVTSLTAADLHYGLLTAAFPSLHCAWAEWTALTLRRQGLGRWVWLYPALTTVVVLGSSNHYVLDVMAGFGLLWVVEWTITAWEGRRFA
jgi:hypothetical protein